MKRWLSVSLISALTLAAFPFAAAGVPGPEWGFIGPKQLCRRSAAGFQVNLPEPGGEPQRITGIQLVLNRTLDPKTRYLLTLELESSEDQPREIVVSYRGRRFVSKLGYYEVFHLKKGSNKIRCLISPAAPREDDTGVISIQLGLQQGTVVFTEYTLAEAPAPETTPEK